MLLNSTSTAVQFHSNLVLASVELMNEEVNKTVQIILLCYNTQYIC